MKKLIFYLPILYLYKTRLKTLLKLFSWIYIYIIPIICLLFFQNQEWSLSIKNILYSLLSIITVYNFYEIGYIQNDTETIKIEKNPTMRINHEQLNYYDKYKIIIYGFRFLLGFILIYILSILGSITVGCIYYSIGIVSILIVYQLYNRMRSNWNMLFYFMLSTLKYIAPLFLFPENLTWNLVLLAIFVFPLEKTSEFKAGKSIDITPNIFFRKYILKYDKSRLTSYRVIAYISIYFLSILLWKLDFFNMEHTFLILYMLIYRFFLWILIKIGFKFKDYLK